MTRPTGAVPRLLAAALVLIVVVSVAAAPGAAAPLPALNAKVAEFARSRLGKAVGDGSCLTLAVEALRYAGARQYPLNHPDGNYVWGRRVDQFKDALPGDILQFRDAEFQGKKRYRKGRWISWHYSYPHHTAIVSAVSEAGKLVTVLHQNVGPEGADDRQKKVVQEGTIRVDSLQKGWVRIYRPVVPEGADEAPPAEPGPPDSRDIP